MPPQQHHDLGDDELGDAARVGERRVEDGYAARCAAARSTWLVPTQKQPTAIRLSAAAEHLIGELGAGADAEQVHALERLPQRLAVQRLRSGARHW